MMTRFQLCVGRILAREGGLVDHPSDPGGLTKYGISKRQYPQLDIANLTISDASAIYERDYWEASGAYKLHEPIDFFLFDSAVNQGVGRAVRLLQAAVGVGQDGIIGPGTLAAITRLGTDEAGALFMAQRALHYAALPTFQTFGKGWLKRLFLVAGEA